jgi:hypothetical protein
MTKVLARVSCISTFGLYIAYTIAYIKVTYQMGQRWAVAGEFQFCVTGHLLDTGVDESVIIGDYIEIEGQINSQVFADR